MFKYDILIQFTLSKPVVRVFGDYLKCFNNRMVQGNKTNIMFESNNNNNNNNNNININNNNNNNNNNKIKYIKL